MSHIITVAAFSDNYIWLICDEKKENALIVDPGDATPVLSVLNEQEISPTGMLITHFHHDHVGGIAGIIQKYPDLPVYGPASEPIPHITHPLSGGEQLHFEAINISLEVLNVPGHTAGHIAYYGDGKLFCGDTLFAAGCGRVFNGTLEELHHSLQKIKALPADTSIYCAHEYTLDNIGFAKWVEPDSGSLLEREAQTMALMDAGKPSVPSLLELELETNPFLRTNLPHVKEQVEKGTGKKLQNSAEVFAAMRTWKDRDYD